MKNFLKKSEMDCTCCLLELDEEQTVYYQHSGMKDDESWILSKFCWETINTILNSKYKEYMEKVYTSKCKKELGGMIESGPPIWFTDAALPVPDGEHIIKFKTNNGEIDAIYVGATQGDERQKIWDHIKEVMTQRMKFFDATDL